MSDEQALIAVILADPANDLPRIVFADWFEDQGRGERAEFIRVQCEMERAIEPAHRRLERRGWELIQRYGHTWAIPGERVIVAGGNFGSLIRCSLRDGPTVDFDFARGFVESVGCPSSFWISDGDAITAAHPVSRVRLTTWPRLEHRALTRMPPIYQVRLADVPGSEWRDQIAAPGEEPPVIELLRTRWPGITFELPAERTEVYSGGSGYLSVNGGPPVRIHDWQIDPAAADEYVRVMQSLGRDLVESMRVPVEMLGNAVTGLAETMLPVITAAGDLALALQENPDPPTNTAPRARPRRPDFSDRGWQPRFPRPR